MTTQSNKPLTIKQASEFTGFSVPYLYKLIHLKKIPYYKPAGATNGKVLFSQEELQEYCFSNRQATNKELTEQAEKILTGGNV